MNERLYHRLTATLCLMLSYSWGTDIGAVSKLITRISKSAQVLIELGQDLHLTALQKALVAEIPLSTSATC